MNQSLTKIPSHTPVQTQTTWTHSASGSRSIWPSNQHPSAYDPAPSWQPEPLTLHCAEGTQHTELQYDSFWNSLGKGSLDTVRGEVRHRGNGFHRMPFYILFRLSSSQQGDFLVRVAQPGSPLAQTPPLPSKVSWGTLSSLISWVLIFK